MATSGNRFDRNERLFGRAGQQLLRAAEVAVFGIGGLGTHVVQQLAYLGVGRLHVVDREELADTDRNRYIGSLHDDAVPGSPKVDLAERLVAGIDPRITVHKVHDAFPSERSLNALLDAAFVFGCVDDDGVRFVLNEACQAYEKVYFDLASDVPEEDRYGGRVTVVDGGAGCLLCRDVLDMDEVRKFLSSPGILANEAVVYGVPREALGTPGPSVVSINGAVASLGVTEFMAYVTGMRKPVPHLIYRAHSGTVARSIDDPRPDCSCCTRLRGTRSSANIARYFPRSPA